MRQLHDGKGNTVLAVSLSQKWDKGQSLYDRL